MLSSIIENIYQARLGKIPSRAEVYHSAELQAIELERCKRYLPYFMFRWAYTRNEMNIDSNLPVAQRLAAVPHTIAFCKGFEQARKLLVPKSRKMQLSWMCCISHLWEVWRQSEFSIIFQAQKNDTASDLVTRSEYTLDHLPDFLVEGRAVGERFHSYGGMRSRVMTMPNKSLIRALPAGADQARTYTANRIYADEAAFQEDFEETLTGMLPCLQGGGKIIITSSVAQSHFVDLVDDTDEGQRRIDGLKIAPEIEDWGKGLRFWTNPGNKWSVLEIHYSADPAKDPDTPEGATWLKAEKDQITNEATWLQEMEIDAQARGALKIYPQFSYADNVIDLPDEELDDSWTIYMAIDPGIDHPCGAVWIAVTKENQHIVIAEHVQDNATVSENIDMMTQIENIYGLKPYLRLIDPAARSRVQTTGTSVKHEFLTNGWSVLEANNDWLAGVNKVRDQLIKGSDGFPNLLISSKCIKTINQFQKYKYNTKRSNTIGEDCCLDCIRYIEMFNPTYIDDNLKVRSKYKTIRLKNGSNVHCQYKTEEDDDD